MLLFKGTFVFGVLFGRGDLNMLGLKINLQESNLFRIGMDWKEIVYFSGLVWCKPDKLPFDYLGLPVGQNMSRIVNWKSVMQKFFKRQSNWKLTTFYIGDQARFLKQVLRSISIYYMSLFLLPIQMAKYLEVSCSRFFQGGNDDSFMMPWVKWDLVLTDKSRRGFDIGSLVVLNFALLKKQR